LSIDGFFDSYHPIRDIKIFLLCDIKK